MHNGDGWDGNRRAVIYVRIASGDQADRLALERQTSICRAAAKRHSLTVVGEYRDVGRPGHLDQCPGLQRMLDGLAESEVAFVITSDLARLSRNVGDLDEIRSRLTRAGVGLVVGNVLARMASVVGGDA